MAYRVVKTENRWDSRGDPIDVRKTEILATDDIVEAFIVRHESDDQSRWGAEDSLNVQVLDDDGKLVDLSEAYRFVVGEDVYQANLADPSFSINLDNWIVEQAAARSTSTPGP